MKVSIFFTLSLLCVLTYNLVTAQSKPAFPVEDSIVLGKSLLTDMPIIGKVLTYPYEVYDVKIDTNSTEVFVVTRNKRRYSYKNNGILFSYNSNSQKSTFILSLEKQFALAFTDSVILMGNGFTKSIYNRSKRNQINDKVHCFIYASPQYNIGIDNHFEGINLLDGSIIWTCDLKKSYIKETIALNDSIILVNMDGVHQINIFTGKGWNYTAKTTSDNTSKKKLNPIYGMPLCSSIGVVSAKDYQTGEIVGISSTMIIKDDKLFFASKNSIVCLNVFNGEVIWSKPLPCAAMSSLDMKLYNDHLILTGLGYAYKSGSHVAIGRTFNAAFEYNYGYQEYFIYTNESPNLIGMKIDYGKVYQLFPDRIITFDYLTGKDSNKFKLKSETKSNFTALFNHKDLFTTDSDKPGFFKIGFSDGVYVYNRREQSLYSFLPDLSDYQIQESNQTLTCLVTHKSGLKYIFNTNTNSAFLVDSSYKIVAKLDMGSAVKLCGNQLIAQRDKSILILDLSSFLKP